MKDRKINKNKKDDTDKSTSAINYPDTRFDSTAVARPDEDHVKEARDWTQEHQQ